MQRAIYRTCHPRQIHAKAVDIVSDVTGSDGRTVQSVAETASHLYAAATARGDYTRTVALLVQYVMIELAWRDHALKMELQAELVDIATSTFINGWMDVFKVAKTRHTENVTDLGESLFAVTAFLGDLFAMGLVSTPVMQSSIFYVVDNLQFISHYRGLYILLARATSHLAPRLGVEFLEHCRDLAFKKAYLNNLGPNADLEIYSVIEIIDEVIYTMDRDAQEPWPCYASLACHRWDKTLSFNSMFDSSSSRSEQQCFEIMH